MVVHSRWAGGSSPGWFSGAVSVFRPVFGFVVVRRVGRDLQWKQ